MSAQPEGSDTAVCEQIPLPPTKKSTFMTNRHKKMLCEYHRDNPKVTQFQLKQWLLETHGLKVAQSTISMILKQSSALINGVGHYANPDLKRVVSVKNPDLEQKLLDFVLQNPNVRITGDLLKREGAKLAEGTENTIKFSNGWLNRFKIRHGLAERRGPRSRQKRKREEEGIEPGEEDIVQQEGNDEDQDYQQDHHYHQQQAWHPEQPDWENRMVQQLQMLQSDHSPPVEQQLQLLQTQQQQQTEFQEPVEPVQQREESAEQMRHQDHGMRVGDECGRMELGGSEDESEDEEEEEAPRIRPQDARHLLDMVKIFFQQQEGDRSETLASIRKMRKEIGVIARTKKKTRVGHQRPPPP